MTLVEPASTVEVMDHHGVVLIGLAGELTAAQMPTVLEAVEAVLASRPRNVQLGLAGVTFMDSGGLQCLVRVRQRVAGARVPMQLLGPSRAVRRVLDVTNMAGVFDAVS